MDRKNMAPQKTVEETSIFNANDSLTEKLRKINELGSFNENERKNLRQRAQEKRDAIRELSNQMADEVVERLTNGGTGSFAEHFRSIGRFLGKYSKTNQLLIEAQRPCTVGVASRGTWERHGYEITGNAVSISQSSTFLKHGDAAVEKWLAENPLKEVVDWYQKTAPGKQGKPFAEYILERLQNATSPDYKRLAGEIESHVKRFTRTDTPTEAQRRLALDFYVKSKIGLVVSGTSKIGTPEGIADKQKSSEEAHWHMRPPFNASKAFTAFCAVIYSKKLGEGATKRTEYEEEKERNNFIARYKKWSNENYMRERVNEAYSLLLEKQSENKKNGVETPDNERVGFYPIVSFPYMGYVFAFEDVKPTEKAKPLPMGVVGIECDEELYQAVKSVFSMEFPIEEIPGVIPQSMKSANRSAVAVSLNDKPGYRVLDIVRTWSEKKTASMGSNAPVFKEMVALSILTSIGMDNPFAESLVVKDMNKDELRAGLEFAYGNISDILRRLRKNIGSVVDEKISEYMQKRFTEQTAAFRNEPDTKPTDGECEASNNGVEISEEETQPDAIDFSTLAF